MTKIIYLNLLLANCTLRFPLSLFHCFCPLFPILFDSVFIIFAHKSKFTGTYYQSQFYQSGNKASRFYHPRIAYSVERIFFPEKKIYMNVHCTMYKVQSYRMQFNENAFYFAVSKPFTRSTQYINQISCGAVYSYYSDQQNNGTENINWTERWNRRRRRQMGENNGFCNN